jgi:hypothetical protein
LSAAAADSTTSTVPTSASEPVFGRAAIAILGTMIFLILALSAVLVQTTWVDPADAAEVAPLETSVFAQH